MTPITSFFGDGEHTFKLDHPRVRTVETEAKAGIGLLLARVQGYAYSLDDLLIVIRHGLIGGGKTPAEAERLVRDYAPVTPIADLVTLTLGILDNVFFRVAAAFEAAETGDLSAAVSDADV